ncbi:MAG: hypothetical protein Q9174_006936 [Haloplaca sp. 1 TL-2023]
MKLITYLNAFLLFLATFVFAAPTVPIYSSSSQHDDFSPVSLAPYVAKRSWETSFSNFLIYAKLPNPTDWTVRFHNFFFVDPNPYVLAMAAQDLLRFYSTALTLAKAIWSRDQAGPYRRVQAAGVALVFWSDAPISWDFLKGFLETMIERTREGFVAGYDMVCIDHLTGVSVRITLSITSSAPAEDWESSS